MNYLPEERRQKLLEQLEERGTLRVSDISRELGVTPVTIRRDIALLADEGKADRIRGGIRLPGGPRAEATDTADYAAQQPSRTIGMIVPRLDYYWPEVVRGAEEAATAAGAKLILRESIYDLLEADLEQIERLTSVEKVDGLLLTVNVGVGAKELVPALSSTQVPAVLVERRMPDDYQDFVVDSVVSDHEHGVELAVTHLRELGHEKIGLVIGRGGPTGPVLHDGWLRSAGTDGRGDVVDITLDMATMREAEGQRAFETVFRELMRTNTTALIFHADAEANAFMQFCEQKGVRIPDDLSIVAYDDELASLFYPPFSAVRPPRFSVGVEAVRLLLTRLEDPAWPARRLLLSPGLSVRKSSAPRRTVDGDAGGTSP